MSTANFWTNPLLQNEDYWQYLPNNLPLATPEDFINYEAARMAHVQQHMNPNIKSFYDALDAALVNLGIPFEFETVEAFTPAQPAFRKYRIPGLWDNAFTMVSPTMNMTAGAMAANFARQFYGNRIPNIDQFIESKIGKGQEAIDLSKYHPIEGMRSKEFALSNAAQPYRNWFNEYYRWMSGPGFKTSVGTGPGGFTEWQTQPWNKPQFPEGAFAGYGARGGFAGAPVNVSTGNAQQPRTQANASGGSQPLPNVAGVRTSLPARTSASALPTTQAGFAQPERRKRTGITISSRSGR